MQFERIKEPTFNELADGLRQRMGSSTQGAVVNSKIIDNRIKSKIRKEHIKTTNLIRRGSTAKSPDSKEIQLGNEGEADGTFQQFFSLPVSSLQTDISV